MEHLSSQIDQAVARIRAQYQRQPRVGIILGSGLGDGNSHSYLELPMIIAGSGGGRVQTGRQITCAEGTPLANLWLSLGRDLGLAVDEFADSTGPLTEYLAP